MVVCGGRVITKEQHNFYHQAKMTTSEDISETFRYCTNISCFSPFRESNQQHSFLTTTHDNNDGDTTIVSIDGIALNFLTGEEPESFTSLLECPDPGGEAGETHSSH